MSPNNVMPRVRTFDMRVSSQIVFRVYTQISFSRFCILDKQLYCVFLVSLFLLPLQVDFYPNSTRSSKIIDLTETHVHSHTFQLW